MTSEITPSAAAAAMAIAPSLGYRLVLPPGWVRIPLRSGTEQAVTQILDASIASLGRDVPRDKITPLRRELQKRLLAAARTARENEGLDLYLPVERRGEQTVAASVVVALLRFDSIERPRAEDVLVALAARSDTARFAEFDGAGAVRTEAVAGPTEGAGDDSLSSRRVEYVLEVPDGSDSWLSFAFGTVGDGDADGEVAHLLVELFDAIMSTLRWVRSDTAEAPAAVP